MTRHELVEIDADRNALCSRKPTDQDLPRIACSIEFGEVIFSDEMYFIIDRWVLADSAFEIHIDDFANQLDRHPAVTTFAYILDSFRGGVRTYIAHDTV